MHKSCLPHFTVLATLCFKNAVFSHALFTLVLATTLDSRYVHSPCHRLANTSSKRTNKWPKVKDIKCQNFSPGLLIQHSPWTLSNLTAKEQYVSLLNYLICSEFPKKTPHLSVSSQHSTVSQNSSHLPNLLSAWIPVFIPYWFVVHLCP